MLIRTLFLTTIVTVGGPAADPAATQQVGKQPEVKRIAADDAAAHVGEKVAVEMTVKSSRFLPDVPICFLNSRTDFRRPKTFTVVIRQLGIAAFEAKKIDDAAKHFHGKKICVTGRIELFEKRPQIVVDKPEQIRIVKTAGTAK